MPVKIGNGLNLQSQRIQNLGAPSAGSDAATKDYVDAGSRGLDWKASVRAAASGNVTVATPGASIDGVTLAANDRVLLMGQTAGAENGIYVWSASGSPLVRAVDADSSAEVTSGMAVSVSEGTANGDKVFLLTTNDPITLGTTTLAFSQLGGGSAAYTGGPGLTLTGQDFAVGQGNGILVDADAVRVDPAVVARKFSQVIGNGTLTSITVTHNLGTRDVHCTVRDAASPYEEVLVDSAATDANTVTLTFGSAPAASSLRVTVIG